jgi:hypothetical protein
VASPAAWNASQPALDALGAQLAAVAAVQGDVRVAAVGPSAALVYSARLAPLAGGLPAGLANPANPAAGRGAPAPRNDSATDAWLLDLAGSSATAARVAGYPSAYRPAAAAARCVLRGPGGSAGLFEYGGWNEPFGFITGGARLVNVTPGGDASFWAADVAGTRGGFAHAAGARAAAAAACAGAGTVYLFGGLQQALGGAGASGALRASGSLVRLQVVASGEKAPAGAAPALDPAAGVGAPAAAQAAGACAATATLLVLPSAGQLLWVHVVETATGQVRRAHCTAPAGVAAAAGRLLAPLAPPCPPFRPPTSALPQRCTAPRWLAPGTCPPSCAVQPAGPGPGPFARLTRLSRLPPPRCCSTTRACW